MKRLIAVILLICLSTNLCGCGYVIRELRNYSSQKDLNTTDSTEENKINTAYPEDVFATDMNVLTVEDAEAALRERIDDLYYLFPDDYELEYEGRTVNLPAATDNVIFMFIISVPYEYGIEKHRGKVSYTRYKDDLGRGRFDLSPREAIDIQQIAATFTDMGRWTYDDEENHIMVNFIRYEEGEHGIVRYIVEYEIAYYARYWTGAEWVESVSEGEDIIMGSKEYDGYLEYLSIDLRDFYGEDGEKMDRGRIEVYPKSGVYWDALHANGPYELTKG